MQAYNNRVPDSVRFDQVQITDVPEQVPVHLWLDHTITNTNAMTVLIPFYITKNILEEWRCHIPRGCMHPVIRTDTAAAKLVIVELPSYYWRRYIFITPSYYWRSRCIFILVSHRLSGRAFHTWIRYLMNRWGAGPCKWCSILYYIILARCLIKVNITACLPFLCNLSLIHIWRCRRSTLCRSRWSPYH